jgi:hypothetical protein
MLHQTKITKNMHGQWVATSYVTIGGNHVLTLTTTRTYSGYVTSNASVSEHKDGVQTHMIYQDYSKQLMKEKYARVTSKVVETQHMMALGDMDRCIEEAQKMYGYPVTVGTEHEVLEVA